MSSATPRATSLWSRIAGGSKPPAWALVDFRDDRDDHEADRQVPATAPTAVLDGPLSPSPSSPPPSMLSPKDFKFMRDLGSGSWSTVMEAVHATTNKRYAVKILSKSQLIKQKKVKYANVEKDALAKLSGTHPGFVKMYAAFQDETSLYFVLELAPHGDLADLVKKSGSLSLRCSQWYTAQIVDAVLWMHSKGILHRDIKPENVLLDNEMRVKLTDLGSAYIAPQGDLSPRSSSFVGSAAYVSPELLDRTSKSTSNSSDIWAIGCTLCFMVAGTPPFAAANDYQTFRKIEALDYTYPEEFYVLARDLTQQLLVLDPSCRLGIEPKSSPALLRNHPFFIGEDDPELTPIRWDTLWKDAPVPPGTGIVKPAPSLPAGGDDDDLWDNVVQNFSLVNIGSRADGSLSPTCPLPSGTPVDVPPDIAPCEVTETVHVSENNPQDGVRQGDDDDLSDPALKAKDWSNILRPGESIRHVVSVQTMLRLGLSRQQRTCALLLTSLPGVLCVAFKEKDQAAKQSDVKHVLAFQESDDSHAKKCEKYEVIVSCSLEDSQQRLVLRTGEKEYRYEFAERNVLSGWQREIDCLVRLHV